METQTKIIIAIVSYCIFAYVLSLFSPQTLRGGIFPRLFFPFLILLQILKSYIWKFWLLQYNKKKYRQTTPGIWHYNKLQKQWYLGAGSAPNREIYLQFVGEIEVYTIEIENDIKYLCCETYSPEKYYDEYLAFKSIEIKKVKQF